MSPSTRAASLELLSATVAAERDAQLRHADAIDAKAGIVLGFSGALVAISSVRAYGLGVAGIAAAVAAAVVGLLIFFPRHFPVFDLPYIRDQYLRSEPGFTQLHLLDTELVMAEQQYAEIRHKQRLLKLEIVLLVAAVVLSAVGIIGSDLGS